jgi:D-glycero-D-manno-heptose 1,7-bisphosphate phosphatase
MPRPLRANTFAAGKISICCLKPFPGFGCFQAAGYLTIVLTNQRGIALGLYSHAELEAIHEKMRAELAAQGALLDDIFYCPHGENACDCRKPLPGLVRAAQQKWDIDLSASLLIGDSERDRLLAERCGIPFARVLEGRVIETIQTRKVTK